MSTRHRDMVEVEMFPCKKCGACCKKVGVVPWGKAMALPDDSCRWLDPKTHLCQIYDRRPLSCRVDEFYEKKYMAHMSREEFYQLNQEVCLRLREEKDIK